MSDDLTARDVIARALSAHWDGKLRPLDIANADALVAALAAAGYTIVTTDDWEWGARWSEREVGTDYEGHEEAARSWAQMNAPARVVRRRPAGPWEVVPDAR